MSEEVERKLARLAIERGLGEDVRLTLLEAYDVAFSFIDAFWERGLKQSDDIANLLSFMSRDVWESGWSMDPAQLHDWMNAVARVRQNQLLRKGSDSHA
jgi:hypothetical protein